MFYACYRKRLNINIMLKSCFLIGQYSILFVFIALSAVTVGCSGSSTSPSEQSFYLVDTEFITNCEEFNYLWAGTREFEVIFTAETVSDYTVEIQGTDIGYTLADVDLISGDTVGHIEITFDSILQPDSSLEVQLVEISTGDVVDGCYVEVIVPLVYFQYLVKDRNGNGIMDIDGIDEYYYDYDNNNIVDGLVELAVTTPWAGLETFWIIFNDEAGYESGYGIDVYPDTEIWGQSTYLSGRVTFDLDVWQLGDSPSLTFYGWNGYDEWYIDVDCLIVNSY